MKAPTFIRGIVSTILHSRLILVAGISVLILSSLSFALLVNTVAGLGYAAQSLEDSISRTENELARNQALLLDASYRFEESAKEPAALLEAIGSDLSYLRTAALVAEATQ